jgi:signal transduction histidine kinase
VLLKAAPLDPADPKAGEIITVIDITERKQAEAERREMENRLQLAHKLESVGRLAAGVAHEINTPTQFVADNARFLTTGFAHLNAIIASYRALKAKAVAHGDCAAELATVEAAELEHELDYLAGEIPRTLEQSLDGLGRIARIVGSLKEFSHPNATERSLADLNRAIEIAVAVSRHEWKYVADVVTELDPELPGVPCMLDEVNQAILNLIINAAHAISDVVKPTGGRGRITVRTRHEPDWAIIEVADTGTGIPAEIRSRIFEPFFTTKGIGQGTGQGLAIVRGIVVKGYHGRVDFTTEVGRGTTFRLALPISRPAGTAPGAGGGSPTLSPPAAP